MVARLPVHVRELPNGCVVATCVDFPELTVDGDELGAVLRDLERRARDRVRGLSGSVRAVLTTSRDATLRHVVVTVASAGGERLPVTVRIAIVVWAVQTSAGVLHVVRAPEVPGFELALSDRGQIDAHVARALGRGMKSWSLLAVLSSDALEESRLVELEVAVPPAAGKAAGTPNDDASIEDSGEELTQLAAEGRLGRLDHRDPIVERVLSALSAPGRSSVLLVGQRDVGKSALVSEVAARMASGDVPPALRDRALWRISANELIAGARYTGMWQARARMLLARARADGSVFAMGDPTGIVDAGRWNESSNNLSRVLRPAMESGELTVICECTPEALSAVARKEPSFAEVFHRVDLVEPSAEDAAHIVATAAGRLETAHGVRFAAGASAAAIELTTRFEPYGALPGKAVRLLEEVVQRGVGGDDATVLDREDVIASFSQRTGLLKQLLSDEVAVDLRQIEEFLERRVLGQPEAVAAMVDLFAVIKAGLQDLGKPLGSYFFVGPTGVGKTELAKAVAEQLFGDRGRMLRFDMGEYRAGDAVAKLIGTGWRADSEGELTRGVRAQPFCVLLLDEIEKAHPDVFDALLAVLGEGRLTDAAGRTADFRNTVIVMTSNLGAGSRESRGLGFSSEEQETLQARRQHFVERAERFFRPEFFNRIDRVVAFRSLDRDTIARIARREIGRLAMREGVTRRRLLVEIDEAVVEHCAEAGFHPQYGARPLQREIERAISQPLARIVVGERAQAGDLIRFRVRDGRVVGTLHRPTLAPESRPPRPRRPTREQLSTERLADRAVELQDRLLAQAGDPVALAVAEESQRLLLATHEPGFWDDPEQARSVLTRYYQLDRCTAQLRALGERVEGLVGVLEQPVSGRAPTRLAEFRAALEEIQAGADLLSLEIAGAASGSSDSAAVVRVTPVGRGAGAWSRELVGMYAAWAQRTGRQVTPLRDRVELEIDGLSSYELLRGEHGLHRRSGDEGPALLARVSVAPKDAGGEPHDPEGAVIVRHYNDGERQFVRDPRTGVRVTGLSRVLADGDIDAFLLETARRRSAGRP